MENKTINILLVDDDAEYATLVKHLLHSYQKGKFELTWVNNGDKAIEHLKSRDKTDLVLMDYYLPEKNGLEIIKQMITEKISVPIILLTSNKDFRTAVEAMKYGVEDYLIKEAIVDTILPRTILHVLERVELKKHISAAEKEKLLVEKRTEAVQELVVTMCHEFNNPLAAIKISTDILSRQKISEQEKELLDELNRNIGHLQKQITTLRDLNIEKQL